MRSISLFCFAFFTVIALAAFPYYDYIHLGVTAIYAYFRDDKPVAVKVAWWGSFIQSSNNVIQTGIDACKICKDNHENSASLDCARAVSNLAATLVTNLLSIYVGWHYAGTLNGSLEGGDPTALRKRRLRHCESTNDLYDVSCVTDWLFDHYSQPESGKWYPIDNSLTKRDLTQPSIYLKHNETSEVYHLIFNPSSGSTGTLAIAPTNIAGNSTLAKRQDLPVYSPLCTGYIALDFCANQSKWGGFYTSGELENELNEIFANDVNGSWKANYYKMYTCEATCDTQDWEVSFRLYYASVGQFLHWTKCDTGS
ncbi:hypothetical protein KAFR_0D00100 [Kazachstania africana CBS 2517]|uniref:Uncharacterized protein n=1 Tax=Kazachstania africana (strain ATCC 22294 / BCRC 22015 / CBS 2517 / CECT 1963 / NBRC 1671 / NRRL Y-8276) TaxID=1071382 RepID=H2ATF6_KAZAF|nr:hypothetical protein KAFR_0D00100 [Kazachstania africana CBS 2517]CCF57656.1 hypothetical protein KAFR_0D00100 [Kazachstania africana CBS 2517]